MKKRILIIDDEPDILKTTKLALEYAGYEVDTAESGEAGLDKLNKAGADLLLLDLRLPTKSGFQIAREIKSKDKYKYTPIIALSALSDGASKHIAAKSDVVAFVEKPIDLEKLKFHIKDILGE